MKHYYLLPFLILLAFLSACTSVPSGNQALSCQPIWGLDTLLNPGQVVLLGEIHGTVEGPGYVGKMACVGVQKGLKVSVGLELPQTDKAAIHTYLQSDGEKADKQRVLTLPFWAKDYQDGRSSQAMFDLLESLRNLKAQNHQVEVFLIDEPGAADRDFTMAQNVIAAAQKDPSRFFLILTGNYHNIITPNAGKMGRYVLEALGREKVTSLNQTYRGGTAWVDIAGQGFGPAAFLGDGMEGVGIVLNEGLGDYHGTFEMDSIHHSRPAKEGLGWE